MENKIGCRSAFTPEEIKNLDKIPDIIIMKCDNCKKEMPFDRGIMGNTTVITCRSLCGCVFEIKKIS